MAFDIFGIGNAIVDTIAFVDDGFPESLGLRHGAMTLADARQQAHILQALQKHQIVKLCSGGSAANSVWAAQQSGANTCYSGRVAADPNGKFYVNELREHGIHFANVIPTQTNTAPTGTCVVFTTKSDAQRTMSTHLGIAVELSANDIDMDLLKRSRYVYCEGYLWTATSTRQACLSVMQEAKKENITVAFSYSDPFVAREYCDDFKRITREYCDIIFCNAHEAQELSQTQDRSAALKFMQEQNALAFVSDGAAGAYVCQDHAHKQQPGFSVKAIDTNGAGDAFAGGVLAALAQNYTPLLAARWGNYLGSRVVLTSGARLALTDGLEQPRQKIAELLQ